MSCCYSFSCYCNALSTRLQCLPCSADYVMFSISIPRIRYVCRVFCEYLRQRYFAKFRNFQRRCLIYIFMSFEFIPICANTRLIWITLSKWIFVLFKTKLNTAYWYFLSQLHPPHCCVFVVLWSCERNAKQTKTLELK